MLTTVRVINAGYTISRTGPRNRAMPAKSKVDTIKPIPKVISKAELFPIFSCATSQRKKLANRDVSTIAVVRQAKRTAKHTQGAAIGPKDSMAIIPNISCGGALRIRGE